MPRLKAVKPEQASGETKEIYQGLEKDMGRVLNIFQHMGNAPAVLQGFLDMGKAAGKTSLSLELREEIALAVAQANQCNYCLAAHSAVADSLGIEAPLILRARQGEADDPKTQAILQFARAVVQSRAQVTDEQIKTLHDAGIGDQEIVEALFVVIINMFTNYFNHTNDTEIDFPQVQPIN